MLHPQVTWQVRNPPKVERYSPPSLTKSRDFPPNSGPLPQPRNPSRGGQDDRRNRPRPPPLDGPLNIITASPPEATPSDWWLRAGDITGDVQALGLCRTLVVEFRYMGLHEKNISGLLIPVWWAVYLEAMELPGALEYGCNTTRLWEDSYLGTIADAALLVGGTY